MKLTFLGTGTSQGIPLINCKCKVCISKDKKDKRLRSSIYLETENCKLLFDAGPDLRYQALSNSISQVDAVIFTHNHSDHTAGIDDLRPFQFKSEKPIQAYGDQSVLDDIRQRFYYAFFENPYPGAIQLDLHKIQAYEEFEIQKIKILPINILHGDLNIFGFKIDNLVYITDAKIIPQYTIDIIKNCKVLVINALRNTTHNTHLSLEEALNYVNKINPQKAYLTHMSHQIGLHSELSRILPDNVLPAYDGLEIIL